jgi:hypothetical protein
MYLATALSAYWRDVSSRVTDNLGERLDVMETGTLAHAEKLAGRRS